MTGEWNPSVWNCYLRTKYEANEEDAILDGGREAPKLDIQTAKGLLSHVWGLGLAAHELVHNFYGYDSFYPETRDVDEKRKMYEFTTENGYPPHLKPNTGLPPPNPRDIFNDHRFQRTQAVITRTIAELGDEISGAPGANEDTIAGISERSKELMEKEQGVQDVTNVSERTDWYSDAIFAQQFFTGPNPMIVKKATSWHLDIFRIAADAQKNTVAQALLNDQSSVDLWVADYSYFRKAAGLSAEEPITPGPSKPGDQHQRFGCASIVLFHLSSEGQIHPSAIVLDYKGSIEKSVTIFNKRLRSSDPPSAADDELNDWPWRYAKTCAIAADWVDHELRVHLTEAHFIDEATIVAIERSFGDHHPICELLRPHWVNTLSLNALSRVQLVPGVINAIGPFTGSQNLALVNYYYKNFNWKDRYVPAELPARGFPIQALERGEKLFRNYTYGRNMVALWPVLKEYVSQYLHCHATTYPQYETDEGVKNDQSIQRWYKEMTSEDSANITGFPQIQTRGELVDALTACLHIASPQHNAINYLQNYYMAFVISKPPSIYAPLPKTLEELEAYGEPSLIRALPTGLEKVRQWLLASHLPWLLSYPPDDKYTLFQHAKRVATVPGDAQRAGEYLVEELKQLTLRFSVNSRDIRVVTGDPKKIVYDVMDPTKTALSILL